MGEDYISKTLNELCYNVLEDIQQWYNEHKINSVEDCKEAALKAVEDMIYTKQDVWDILEELDIENVEEPVDNGCKTMKDVAIYWVYENVLYMVDFNMVFKGLEDDTLKDDMYIWLL